MDVAIESDFQNNVLKRREIKFAVTQDSATVSKADMLAELCKKFSASPESSIIVWINQSFGEKRSSGIIHIYQSREVMERTEPKHILKRSGKLPEAKETQKPEGAPKPKEAGAHGQEEGKVGQEGEKAAPPHGPAKKAGDKNAPQGAGEEKQ